MVGVLLRRESTNLIPCPEVGPNELNAYRAPFTGGLPRWFPVTVTVRAGWKRDQSGLDGTPKATGILWPCRVACSTLKCWGARYEAEY